MANLPRRRLDQAFGYVKNVRLFITENRIENLEAHVAWASGQDANIVKQEIFSDLARTIKNIDNEVSKSQLDETFGHIKNARLVIAENRTENWNDHVIWASGQNASIVKQEIRRESTTIKSILNGDFTYQKSFPILLQSTKVHNGRANWEASSHGILILNLKGKNSGAGGSVRFSSCLVLTDDEDNAVYISEWRHLTVGANIVGIAEKEENFTDFPKVPDDVLKDVVGGFILFEREKGDGTLAEILTKAFYEGGEVFDAADLLYTKIKNSEIVRDIAIATAG